MLPELSQKGTRLGTIDHHTLFVECGCGNKSEIAVSTLLTKFSRKDTIGFVKPKLRCSRCGQNNIKHMLIFWRGNSAEAMEGTRSDS